MMRSSLLVAVLSAIVAAALASGCDAKLTKCCVEVALNAPFTRACDGRQDRDGRSARLSLVGTRVKVEGSSISIRKMTTVFP
jgi:hypothetical protein